MRISMRVRYGVLTATIVAALLPVVSCGSSPTSPPAGDPPHTLVSTVMLESSGLNPREITIAVGERVSFMNHDTVNHTVAGGSGPAQPDCPEINAVGVLAPAEIRPTAVFSTVKTCDYHVPRGGAVLFSGRIVVR
jgi:plastocyanin